MDSQQWIRLRHVNAPSRSHGWKLHVSSGPCSATLVLQKALALLFAEQLSFKVARSIEVLMALNRGEYGYSQIGKFITIFPANDEQALRLAAKLDAATRGLRAPAIPSDRRLQHKSLVHYRYGAFRERHIQTASGEFMLALPQSSGSLVPDRRQSDPKITSTPFDQLVACEAPALVPEDQFLLLSRLQTSARGAVCLCFDFVSGRQRVLKLACRDSLLDWHERDAHDRLRHESRILSKLLPDARFPTQFGMIENDCQLFLLLEHIPGENLHAYMERLAAQASLPSSGQVIQWGLSVAKALDTMHKKGIVYRDLKPENVILTPDGAVRIVDFELAYDQSAQESPFGLGSRGYFSPQQAAGNRPCAADDVYSLGSLLYFLSTNTDPWFAPEPPQTRARLTLLNPSIGYSLISVIERCLQKSPQQRYADMRQIMVDLSDLSPSSASISGHSEEVFATDTRKLENHYFALVQRLGDTLCRTARRTNDGIYWVSTHRPSMEIVVRDLGTGSAGILLCLAQLVQEFAVSEWRTLLAEAAWNLASRTTHTNSCLTGLYAGEAGVGAAILRAGQVLGDPELTDWALQCSTRISSEPLTAPDLMTGAAGRLRFHLMVWAATKCVDHLHHALGVGNWLLKNAELSKEYVYWMLPQNYGKLSGETCLGYARGAAGIADTLLDLFDASGREEYLATARLSADWILAFAKPALSDGSGLCWPRIPGEMPHGAFWCHGATGIGRFLLHVSQTNASPEAMDIISRGAKTVSSTRWAGPTQCHGLASNIEFLVDLYQAFGSKGHLDAARALAMVLETFARCDCGSLYWQSDIPEIVTPDYLFGYAGVALSLLRLGNPRMPHELSLENFRQTSRTEAYDHVPARS